MNAIRVILVTVAGPGGHVDVGVRSDATSAELAASLGGILGVSPPWPAAEHRAPPRPGSPRGRRSVLMPGDSLADAGVADGDLVSFRAASGSRSFAEPGATAAQPPVADGTPRAAGPDAIGMSAGSAAI